LYLFAFLLMTAALPAQWLKYPTPGIPRTADGKPTLVAPAPKTADGKPDLSGTWTRTTTAGGRSQLKPPEFKPSALKVSKECEETLGRDNPEVHCLPTGPRPPVGPAKIVQTPALVVILYEDLTYRQIFLDGRELTKEPNPAWMGYSVGRWEGDTLVVESTGYNDRTWLQQGYPHTESLRITERFHRSDFGHLTVDASYSDPGAYDKPWTAKTDWLYWADTDLLEYVCAENEKDSVHLVGTLSDETKNAVRVGPEILTMYVGTYLRSVSGGRPPEEIKIALEDSGLTVSGLGLVNVPLTALSESLFTLGGTHFEFDKNDQGDARYFIIHAAEGIVAVIGRSSQIDGRLYE
jgi:hypothetical protein